MKHKLTIEFDNDEALKHFAHWLCGQGEQDYWIWMEEREQEEKGDITACRFEYFNAKTGPDFLSDYTIRTRCGRMDKEE